MRRWMNLPRVMQVYQAGADEGAMLYELKSCCLDGPWVFIQPLQVKCSLIGWRLAIPLSGVFGGMYVLLEDVDEEVRHQCYRWSDLYEKSKSAASFLLQKEAKTEAAELKTALEEKLQNGYCEKLRIVAA